MSDKGTATDKHRKKGYISQQITYFRMSSSNLESNGIHQARAGPTSGITVGYASSCKWHTLLCWDIAKVQLKSNHI